MNFIILPVEDAIAAGIDIEHARKSIDGKEVILHEEVLLESMKSRGVETYNVELDESGNEIQTPIELPYDSYEYESKELINVLNSNNWTNGDV